MRLLIQSIYEKVNIYQRKMNRLLLALTICFLTVAGCGLGVSEHKDAVLDGLSNLNRGRPEEALEDFEIRLVSPVVPRTLEDGRVQRQRTFDLEAYGAGQYTIPRALSGISRGLRPGH